jgi:eukaryotic-like serine/threonine-protein kinase
VWMLPTAAGGGPRPLLAGAFLERDARLSPGDGKLVAYVSDATGSREIAIQTVEGVKQREAVSAGGGSQPVWSRDGRALYFVDPTGGLRRTPVARGPDGRPILGASTPVKMPLIGSGHYATQYDLSPDGRIYFLDRRVDDPPGEIAIVLGWQALARR